MSGYFNGLREMIQSPVAGRGKRLHGEIRGAAIPIHTEETLTIPSAQGSYPKTSPGLILAASPPDHAFEAPMEDMAAGPNGCRVESSPPSLNDEGRINAESERASSPFHETEDVLLIEGREITKPERAASPLPEKGDNPHRVRGGELGESDEPWIIREVETVALMGNGGSFAGIGDRVVEPVGNSGIWTSDETIPSRRWSEEQIPRQFPDGENRRDGKDIPEESEKRVLIKKGETVLDVEMGDIGSAVEKRAANSTGKVPKSSPLEVSDPSGENWTLSIGAVHLTVEEPPREPKAAPAVAAPFTATPGGNRRENRNSDSRLRRHYLR